VYTDLATLAIFAFLFSSIAGKVEQSWVSGPIIYLIFGLLGGPLVLNFLDIRIEMIELRVLVDLTLALVLFSDAANADLRILRKNAGLPVRLLPV